MKKLNHVLNTVVSVLITLLGLISITFIIGRMLPIDPAIAAVGDNAPQHVVEQVRKEMGLDRPLYVQFGSFLGAIAQGDLGHSIVTKNAVVDDIIRVFPATIELATGALIIAVCVGIPLGVISAAKRGSLIDQIIRVVCFTGYSIPVFMLALFALLIFYQKLGWVPAPMRQGIIYDGMIDTRTGMLLIDTLLAKDYDAFKDALHHLILPTLILAYFSMAYIARMTRTFMIDALNGEFIITARAKGLSRQAVIWKHAFPTIAVQLITILALTYAGLLEGAVITETLFNWPGLGSYLTTSLRNADMNPVVGATLLVGAIYILFNMLSDILYRVMDPRV